MLVSVFDLEIGRAGIVQLIWRRFVEVWFVQGAYGCLTSEILPSVLAVYKSLLCFKKISYVD